MKRLLLVGGEVTAGRLRSCLPDGEYAVVVDDTPSSALERARREPFDAILCDIDAHGDAAVECVRQYVATGSPAAIVVMGAGRLEGALLRAVDAGASAQLTTPFRPDEVRLTLRNIEERRQLRRELVELRAAAEDAAVGGALVVESRAMRDLIEHAGRAAGGHEPILLIGEKGAGKEAVARFIHRAGRRPGERFITVDLAVVPPARIGPVLFGDPHGTGRGGLMADAGGGTLLLDGIEHLPAPVQALLLHALDPLADGGGAVIRSRVRLIATASGPLEERVHAGSFRADLFDRFRTHRFTLPPLRERREDIPSLATHFLAQASARVGRPFSLTARALGRLVEYGWPGNISELRHVIERAAVLVIGNAIDAGDLALGGARTDLPGGAETLKAQVESAERTAIGRALVAAAGNRRTAARALGISLRTLFYKLRRYELD